MLALFCCVAVFLGSSQRYRVQVILVTFMRQSAACAVCACVCVCVLSTCLFSRTAWSAWSLSSSGLALSLVVEISNFFIKCKTIFILSPSQPWPRHRSRFSCATDLSHWHVCSVLQRHMADDVHKLVSKNIFFESAGKEKD